MNKPQNQKRGILSNLERIERFYFGKNQTLVLLNRALISVTDAHVFIHVF